SEQKKQKKIIPLGSIATRGAVKSEESRYPQSGNSYCLNLQGIRGFLLVVFDNIQGCNYESAQTYQPGGLFDEEETRFFPCIGRIITGSSFSIRFGNRQWHWRG